MTRNIRTGLLCGITALLTVVVVAIPAGAKTTHKAKSHKVNMKLVGTLSGITITGTAKGTPFGSCKNKASLVIPKTVQVWTCPGGTVKITGVGTSGAANEATGTWKVTSATGKFKGATGKGTFTGLQSTGTFTYLGTVKY